MHILTDHQPVPVYPFQPDETGNPFFRVYDFEGEFPSQSDLLVPHRKSHYLLVLIRRAGRRQWIDMQPYTLKENAVYFTGPHQIIVKEEFEKLWSTGIAFTKEFLSLQEGRAISTLPLIQNPLKGHEILLSKTDLEFVEDMITKINIEYHRVGEWQQRMLTAQLTVLLTYLSRLYTVQYPHDEVSSEKLLLQQFHAKINECFRELHEVGDYASLLHISAGHLSEVVKTQSGKPAIKHIHERLILEARRLLFHTDHSLKEIAFDLGFAEASYFNRFFKRETAVTPAAYRARIREMYHAYR
jgi:AraC family transcriptional regulator, transcriptional activator of pobA